MAVSFLDFEQPIAELEAKIEELRHVTSDSEVNIQDEIDRLQAKSRQLTQEHLRQPHALADHAARPPSASSLHARLRERHLQRVPRAARRSHVRRRRRHRRRAGAHRRARAHDHRPPEGARHQGARAPQLRHAEARGLPQGAAPDAARRALRAAAGDAHRHAGRLPRRRRRGARSERGDRPQSVRDVGAAHSDRHRRHRRGRLGRRARHRRVRPPADAPVQHLLGHLARRAAPPSCGRARTRRKWRPRRSTSPPTACTSSGSSTRSSRSRSAARIAMRRRWPPRLKAALIRHLDELEAIPRDELRAARAAKIAGFGVYSENAA